MTEPIALAPRAEWNAETSSARIVRPRHWLAFLTKTWIAVQARAQPFSIDRGMPPAVETWAPSGGSLAIEGNCTRAGRLSRHVAQNPPLGGLVGLCPPGGLGVRHLRLPGVQRFRPQRLDHGAQGGGPV